MNSRIAQMGCMMLTVAFAAAAVPRADDSGPRGPFSHVLLISIDGLHAQDLAWYLASPDDGSALEYLSEHGRTYTNATATKPSDSFPGMLAMVTGGTPKSTGVYYDDGWDRTMAAAGSITDPTAPCAAGTRVRWKQNLDVAYPSFATLTFDDYALFWSGPPPLTATDGWPLNPASLPRNAAVVSPATRGCTTRVYPHQFPRVNNVFEVIKTVGGRTAWSDKHPAYEFLNGPSGTGVDDLYTPEIATNIGVAPSSSLTSLITDSFQQTMNYDDLKVKAILNQIRGRDHMGTPGVGVPTLFGMNFQAVSVAQKLDMSSVPGGQKGGYLDANGTPSGPLQAAIRHTDASIGQMVAALGQEGLLDSTLIIISAKHGNSPIDPSTLQRVNPATITNVVNSVQAGLQAQLSADTGPLVWLKDSSKAALVAAAFDANRALAIDDPANAHVQSVLWGPDLAAQFADPAIDSRVPDLILFPIPGTVYGAGPSKIADHGSFYPDDTHVALLVSNSRLDQLTVDEPVETRQIACTILRALGQNCDSLQSEAVEPSMCLPPMGWAFGHAK